MNQHTLSAMARAWRGTIIENQTDVEAILADAEPVGVTVTYRPALDRVAIFYLLPDGRTDSVVVGELSHQERAQFASAFRRVALALHEVGEPYQGIDELAYDLLA